MRERMVEFCDPKKHIRNGKLRRKIAFKSVTTTVSPFFPRIPQVLRLSDSPGETVALLPEAVHPSTAGGQWVDSGAGNRQHEQEKPDRQGHTACGEGDLLRLQPLGGLHSKPPHWAVHPTLRRCLSLPHSPRHAGHGALLLLLTALQSQGPGAVQPSGLYCAGKLFAPWTAQHKYYELHLFVQVQIRSFFLFLLI